VKHEQRCTLRPALLTCTLIFAVPAVAQNNSLLGNGQRGETAAPATPAASPGTVAVAPANGREAHPAERPEGRNNATLLRYSPYAVAKPETQKIKVNDLLTIIVRESKTATTDSKLETKKDWALDSSLSKWIRLSDKHGIVPANMTAGNPAATFDFKNDYKGDGKYDRKDELTTRLTAKVIDVKPNGNLVVEATKLITIDDEGYTITLTGECRSRDVTPDNTLLSTQVANPEIIVSHTGAVRDATRRGWLMRALDLFRPF
jgi:flagellar L-ring protein FlgH